MTTKGSWSRVTDLKGYAQEHERIFKRSTKLEDLGAEWHVFETRLIGIPCQIAYTWEPEIPATRHDPGEAAGPDEVRVYDRRGYEAGWLKAQAERKGADLVELCIEDWGDK